MNSVDSLPENTVFKTIFEQIIIWRIFSYVLFFA